MLGIKKLIEMARSFGEATGFTNKPSIKPADEDIDLQIKEIVNVFRPLFKPSVVGESSKNNVQQSIDRLTEWVKKGSSSVNAQHLGLLEEGLRTLHDKIPDGQVNEDDVISIPHDALLKIYAHKDIIDEAAAQLKTKDAFAEIIDYGLQDILASDFEASQNDSFSFDQPDQGKTFTGMGQGLNTVNDRLSILLINKGFDMGLNAAQKKVSLGNQI